MNDFHCRHKVRHRFWLNVNGHYLLRISSSFGIHVQFTFKNSKRPQNFPGFLKSAQQLPPNVQEGALPHRQVPPRVLGKMVAAHETAVAHGTFKPLLSRVGSAVAGQLIGTGEPPLTAVPLAFEGLLACCKTISV